MILGLGNDIIEIARIKKAIQKYPHRFISRIFTPEEQTYCAKYKYPYPYYAGRFSAKESIAKAFGFGIGKTFSWLDMEIINNQLGKPDVIFSEKINTHFDHPQVLISISHSEHYVATTAIRIK